MSRRAARSRLEVVGLSIIATLALAAFAASVTLMTRSGDEQASAASPTVVNRPDVFTIADHNALPTVAGCEQLAYHAQMAMWSAALADDLLDFDYTFPILSTSSVEPPSTPVMPVPVLFTPLRYQDLLGGLQRTGFEVCTEVRVAEPPGSGFVYGFVFHLRAVSCTSDAPEIEVVVREYATVEYRDAAAHRASDGAVTSLALGRWVLSIEDLEGSGSVELSRAIGVGLDLGGEQL